MEKMRSLIIMMLFITTDVDREHNITGTFKIKLGSQETTSLPYNVNSSTMYDALILMTNIGRVDVSRVEHKGALDQYIWTLLFRAYDGDLNTLQVQPDISFLGKGASIHVQRPRGIKPLSYLIGNADEIQTIALRHTGVLLQTEHSSCRLAHRKPMYKMGSRCIGVLVQ